MAGDMQSIGPYYSHTLLNAVISHSIRWGRSDPSTKRLLDDSYHGGLVFGKHARSMLFEELNNGVCTIPTIQTLLLLSAQECSQGNSTQAWTYSGIAFRLLDHLGICVDSQRFPGPVPLGDEELEIRRRIYWGCYFWDKLICLYLGRSPSLQHTNISPSHIMCKNLSPSAMGVQNEAGLLTSASQLMIRPKMTCGFPLVFHRPTPRGNTHLRRLIQPLVS